MSFNINGLSERFPFGPYSDQCIDFWTASLLKELSTQACFSFVPMNHLYYTLTGSNQAYEMYHIMMEEL